MRLIFWYLTAYPNLLYVLLFQALSTKLVANTSKIANEKGLFSPQGVASLRGGASRQPISETTRHDFLRSHPSNQFG
ncbi:unnamed protein product, partial [Mycena citricolor]